MLGHHHELRVLTLRVALRRAGVALVIAVSIAGAVWSSDEASFEAVPPPTPEPPSPAERLAARQALAARGRGPKFPSWRRGEVLSVDGLPMSDAARPFTAWTVPVRRSPVLFPSTIAEPERWSEVQEQLLPVGECPCSGGSGEPGEVPPPTLRIGKNATPGQVVATWSASCSGQASDYAVEEGTLRTWYSHAPRVCSTGGALSYTFSPSAGNRYLLVVPLTADDEGSYGERSGGEERPPSFPTCRPTNLAEACP